MEGNDASGQNNEFTTVNLAAVSWLIDINDDKELIVIKSYDCYTTQDLWNL